MLQFLWNSHWYFGFEKRNSRDTSNQKGVKIEWRKTRLRCLFFGQQPMRYCARSISHTNRWCKWNCFGNKSKRNSIANNCDDLCASTFKCVVHTSGRSFETHACFFLFATCKTCVMRTIQNSLNITFYFLCTTLFAHLNSNHFKKINNYLYSFKQFDSVDNLYQGRWFLRKQLCEYSKIDSSIIWVPNQMVSMHKGICVVIALAQTPIFMREFGDMITTHSVFKKVQRVKPKTSQL